MSSIRLRVATALSLSSSISKCHSGRCTAITYCVHVSAVIMIRLPLLSMWKASNPGEWPAASTAVMPGTTSSFGLINVDRSTFIKPNDEVVPGITAVDAAGHSPGLLAFHIESNGKRIMITADTCTQYVMAVQRPEWHFEMDDDKDKAVATRKRMLDMLAADKLFVASFHTPFPGIGFIEKGQGGYRWVPHSYQLNL